MRILIFLFVFVFQIFLTIKDFMNTCMRPSYVLYLSHHAFDVFLFWAPLFLVTKLEYTLHFMFALGVGIHWFINDNKCIATVEMNRQCGYDEGQWLNSLKNMFGIRKYFEYFHFAWIGILMAYDIKMILS
jgi:hypothetical protein